MNKKRRIKYSAIFGFILLTPFVLASCYTNNTITGESQTQSGQANNSTFKSYTTGNPINDNTAPLNSSFGNSPISTYFGSVLYTLLTYETIGNLTFNPINVNTQNNSITGGTVKSFYEDYLRLQAANYLVVFKSDSNVSDLFNDLYTYYHPSTDMKQLTAPTTYNDLTVSKEMLYSFFQYQIYLKSGYNPVNKGSMATSSETTKGKIPMNHYGSTYWIFSSNWLKDAYTGKLLSENKLTNGSEYKGVVPDAETDANRRLSFLENQYGYTQAVQTGMTFRFYIKQGVPWLDSNGKIAEVNGVKQYVSGKDYERSLQLYKLAGDINYQRNGYFIDLIGLKFNETAGQKGSDGKYLSVESPNWDTTKFSSPDLYFTYHLKAPYPFILDILSAEYFNALPHDNPRITPIKIGPNSPIVLNSGGSIDLQNTKFNEIYGNGVLGFFNRDVWYAGAYYITYFTATQFVFKLNQYYLEKIYTNFYNHAETKVNTVISNFGNGSAPVFYELFKTGDTDIAGVPPDLINDAVRRYGNNGDLQISKVSKISQSNYITYTPRPYVVDNSGNIIPNNNLRNAANFIYNFLSVPSFTIRAAVAGLINYFSLSSIALPSSSDFQLSAIPYGDFPHYYESVAAGNFYGGLPRMYSDYVNNVNTHILPSFHVPYWVYDAAIDNFKLENLEISQDTLKKAIDTYTTSQPLAFNTKFGESVLSDNYNAYLRTFHDTINNNLSQNKIDFEINLRLGTMPTLAGWFNNNSSPLGFSYWGPDYNDIGTWIESNTGLNQSKVNGQTYYQPTTNGYNVFEVYLKDIVATLKLYKATYDAKMNEFKVSNWEMFADQNYAKDERITKAFSMQNLKALQIESDVTSNGMIELNDKMMPYNPSLEYAKNSLALVNYLIKQKVFDGKKVDALLKNKTRLTQLFGPNGINQPTNLNDVVPGASDVILEQPNPETATNKTPSVDTHFSKFLGEFTSLRPRALYATTVFDSAYWYIPRPEGGLHAIGYTLINPHFNVRSSSTGSGSYISYAYSKDVNRR